MLEVELKAWADLEGVRARLVSLGKRLLKTTDKNDLYYCAPECDPQTCDARRDRIVRVRLEGDRPIVTAKRKSVASGVETSQEIELEVSSASALRELLDYMGYRPFLKKHKETTVFAWNDEITVELNRVEGLGDFVEIEALLPEGSAPDVVEETRGGLRAVATLLGIEGKIEPRPYVDLLRERGVGRA